MSTTRTGSKKLTEDSLNVNLSQQLDDAAAAATAAADAAAAGGGGSDTPTAKTGKAAKKPKFPCGKCDTEVTCGISCNSCEVWFHDKCIDGMTKDYFDNCKKAHELFGFTAFLCKICRKVFNAVNKALKDVKSDLKSMKDRVMVLEQEKEVLAQKLEKIEKGTERVEERVDGVAKEVATGMEKAKEEVRNDVKTEMALRGERGSNIAIYGLCETREEDTEKWKDGETKKVMEVAEQMGVPVSGEVLILHRAGRPREEGAKPRPLIVRVADDETRAKMFQNARLLSRNESTKRVFISQDLTPQQREDDRKAETARKVDAAQRTEQAKNGEKWIVVGARGRRRVVKAQAEVQVAAA